MKRLLIYLFAGLVALMCGIVGYTITAGDLPFLDQAEARSDTMPANPHILYLTSQKKALGALTNTQLNEHRVTRANTWNSTRRAARKRPLDALIIDAASFASRTDAETEWLRSQLGDGVTVVGIGIPDDSLAAALGIRTFQAPGESRRERGDTGYRLIQSYILAQPEDMKILEAFGWTDVQISGSNEFPDGIKSPMRGSYSSAQGQLDTESDLTLFFQRLEERIKRAYLMRAEYQQQLKEKGVR